MEIKVFYDVRTNTLSYVVWDTKTKDCVIIDPVLDFEPLAAKVGYASVDTLMAFMRENQLHLHFILETHAHADHISSAQILKQQFPQARVAVGEKITTVQKTFKEIFELDIPTDGSQFDHLFKDGEHVTAGSLDIEVLEIPGHTLSCVAYKINDAVFVGDTLLMPDYGTGRCDFPGGDAATLYRSITQKLYTLPDTTRVFTGHDYQPNGRDVRWESSIAEQKNNNVHLKATTTQEAYVEFRQARDKTLSTPKLLYPSIQINIAAGKLPRFLKIPLHR
jgi:glyoxylase-like metal-dependent hydrolase (beta-lactamase superfamily II)